MSHAIINLQRLTAPAAVILASAWVAVARSLGDGLIFLLFVGIFYYLLLVFEVYVFHMYE